VVLAEQIGKFTLERASENGEISFTANGQIDFGGREFTRVDGAGGRNWTERLPVRFVMVSSGLGVTGAPAPS
jgi:hypothetical protein